MFLTGWRRNKRKRHLHQKPPGCLWRSPERENAGRYSCSPSGLKAESGGMRMGWMWRYCGNQLPCRCCSACIHEHQHQQTCMLTESGSVISNCVAVKQTWGCGASSNGGWGPNIEKGFITYSSWLQQNCWPPPGCQCGVWVWIPRCQTGPFLSETRCTLDPRPLETAPLTWTEQAVT